MSSPVALVIAFYNGAEEAVPCVESALANGVEPARVYLVDNSTRAGEADLVMRRFPSITLVSAPPRVGYGRACNLGARAALQAGARHVILSNQDLVYAPDCVTQLVAALEESPEVGIAAPVNYTWDFGGIESFFVRQYLAACPGLVADALQGRLRPSYRVPRVMGSCMALRAEAIDAIGLFDELYFMYMEDDDLCRRYGAAGWRIVLCPSARVGHRHSHTAKGADDGMLCQGRKSEAVFRLKDPVLPISSAVKRLVHRNLTDYASTVLRVRPGLLARFVRDDLSVLWRVRRILAARRREQEVIRERGRNPHATPPGAGGGV